MGDARVRRSTGPSETGGDGRGRWLLYGAYGFTGRLIARQAGARGLRPVLAGRDREKTEALARELGLDARVFALRRENEVRAGLAGVEAVLNCAGPFSSTWRAMTAACLAEQVHYLDVTGEIEVLEGIRTLDASARDSGIHMIPAVGFDVVPTDCAAALAVEGRPEATELDLAFQSGGGASRGTARTALEGLDGMSAVRRDGRIRHVPLGSERRTIPFSDGPRDGVAIPWGDVSTAWYSTHVPDIQVFTVLPANVVRMSRVLGLLMKIPGMPWLARRVVDARVTGPDEEELDQGTARIWAEARSADGGSTVVELATPNGYTLTATAAVEAVARVMAGRVARPPGVHTPSQAFGADFVLGLEGVERIR